MSKILLKISAILLVLLGNAVSLGMDVEETFNFTELPLTLQKNVFARAHPLIKNQLKNTSKAMNAVGAKKAPNMYGLAIYDLNIAEKDRTFMMFNAAHDKNIKVMENILEHTARREFDYNFSACSDTGVETQCCISLRFTPAIEELHDSLGNWQEKTPEKIKELNFDTGEFYRIFPSQLMMSWYLGRELRIIDVTSLKNTILTYLCILIDKDDAASIELLLPLLEKKANCLQPHVALLTLAMKNKYQSKKAFEALVKNNVYGCLNYRQLNLLFGGSNTTTLDEIANQKDIPNLHEYIALYKKHGGKTLAEMGYDKNKEYGDIDMSSTNSMEEINSFSSVECRKLYCTIK